MKQQFWLCVVFLALISGCVGGTRAAAIRQSGIIEVTEPHASSRDSNAVVEKRRGQVFECPPQRRSAELDQFDIQAIAVPSFDLGTLTYREPYVKLKAMALVSWDGMPSLFHVTSNIVRFYGRFTLDSPNDATLEALEDVTREFSGAMGWTRRSSCVWVSHLLTIQFTLLEGNRMRAQVIGYTGDDFQAMAGKLLSLEELESKRMPDMVRDDFLGGIYRSVFMPKYEGVVSFDIDAIDILWQGVDYCVPLTSGESV